MGGTFVIFLLQFEKNTMRADPQNKKLVGLTLLIFIDNIISDQPSGPILYSGPNLHISMTFGNSSSN